MGLLHALFPKVIWSQKPIFFAASQEIFTKAHFGKWWSNLAPIFSPSAAFLLKASCLQTYICLLGGGGDLPLSNILPLQLNLYTSIRTVVIKFGS